MSLKGKKVVFLGDSITEGVGASCMEKRYTDVFARLTGAVSVNYGISGTRIAAQRQSLPDRERYDDNFCERALRMDADADIVVVFGGTNDFGHGDAPIGADTDRTPDTFFGAMHVLCEELLTRYPVSEIVFMTPLHRLNEDDPRGDAKPADVGTLRRYVEIMRSVLEYYSIPVLDLYGSGRIQPKVGTIREKYLPDGLHPSDDGHELIARRLKSFLEALQA